jgi:hypothetical protein
MKNELSNGGVCSPNMSGLTEPEDPDHRVHAAWLAQASGDGLLAKEAGGSTSELTSSSAPPDRLAGQEACRGRHGNEGPGGATAGDDREMNNEPLERKPIDRMRAPLEALLKANAAPRCGARSKRTGKPCLGAAMPNGRCKFHGGKSTGPRTPGGLERSRRANWKHGNFSREAKAEQSRLRAAILALRDLRDSI